MKSSLPTLVFFENHLDYRGRRLLTALLPYLSELGYDNICAELPFANRDYLITSLNKYNIGALLTLQKFQITFKELSELVQEMKSEEVTKRLHIRSTLNIQAFNSLNGPQLAALPANMECAKLLEKTKALKMDYQGIDVSAMQVNASIKNNNTMFNRDNSLGENFLKSKQGHKGTILVFSGTLHFFPLYNYINKNDVGKESYKYIYISYLKHSMASDFKASLSSNMRDCLIAIDMPREKSGKEEVEYLIDTLCSNAVLPTTKQKEEYKVARENDDSNAFYSSQINLNTSHTKQIAKITNLIEVSIEINNKQEDLLKNPEITANKDSMTR